MSDVDRKLPLSFLPLPTIARQRVIALLVLIAQAGIAVTGSIVRVSGSGLGCDTWPQCQEGSFTPVAGAAPWIHQAIEFGNRMLTFVLAALTLIMFLAVVRVGRRRAIIWLALLNGLGIVAQAVIGGISVLVDLTWYSVALHFLATIVLVWLAGMLYVKVQEPDDGHPVRIYVKPLRDLAGASGLALAATLVTGTMVTGAGPHAGDASISPQERLQLPIIELSHIHAGFMYLFLGMSIGLVVALIAMKAEPGLRTLGWWLVALIVVQGGVGMVQYWAGVPVALVPVHVAGSVALTGVTAIIWQLGWRHAGGTATATGSPAGDAEHNLANAQVAA